MIAADFSIHISIWIWGAFHWLEWDMMGFEEENNIRLFRFLFGFVLVCLQDTTV